jgi:hypothetical protein
MQYPKRWVIGFWVLEQLIGSFLVVFIGWNQIIAHVIVDNLAPSSAISMANASASCTVFD